MGLEMWLVVDVVRIVSRFQFARPAVVFSFLDHRILTPPVEAERAEIWPLVILVSSSTRNEAANSCFRASKAFLAALASLVGL